MVVVLPPSIRRTMSLIRISLTEEDVLTIAEEHGVSEEVAIERAESWAKSIQETASSLVNEQLEGAIVGDQP